MMTTEAGLKREEAAAGVARALKNIGNSRHLFTPSQLMMLAEQARDLADALDHGEAERMRYLLGRART
jgi:hypothetical protein